MYNVLSLGAGIQSTTIALLIEAGELPPVDCAIFADTQWEPKAVYENLDWLESQVSCPIVRVTAGNLKTDYVEGQRGKKHFSNIPVFVKDDSDESEGRVSRHCTTDYKIAPIEKYIRQEILGLKPRQRVPQGVCVSQWIGISIDELRRVRAPQNRWQEFHYPLIGLPKMFLSRPWSRAMCYNWLTERYPERTFPRSACIGCPQHDNREWREMQEHRPEEFAEAVAFERQIQKYNGGVSKTKYLHRSCQPLDTIDFSMEEQPDLFDNACLGMCGT